MVVEHSLSGNNSPLFSAFATEAVICFLTLLLFSSHKHNTFLFHMHVQWKVNPKPAGLIQSCLILSSIMLTLSI